MSTLPLFPHDMVIVSASGKEYCAHKAFFAENSSVICDFLASCGNNSGISVVPLKLEYSDDALEVVVQCLCKPHSGRPSYGMAAGTVKEVTEIARKYNMPVVLDVCEEFCLQNASSILSVSMCLEWYSFAIEYKFSRFSSACKEFLVANLADLSAVLLKKRDEEDLHTLLSNTSLSTGVLLSFCSSKKLPFAVREAELNAAIVKGSVNSALRGCFLGVVMAFLWQALM